MNLFKSLFFKNSSHKDNEDSLTVNFSDNVKKAIILWGNNYESLDEEKLIEIFDKNGITEEEGDKIILFLPMAFCRCFMQFQYPNEYWNWQTTYRKYVMDKKFVEKEYSKTSAYVSILQETKNYFANEPDEQVVMQIAGFSAEFKIIHQFFVDGYTVKEVAEKVKEIATAIT